MRLITNTYCECTRDARYKSEVKDSYPEKKSPTKKMGLFRVSLDQKRFLGSQENHRKITGKSIDIFFMNCGVLVLKKKRKVKTTIHTHTCDTISSDIVHQTKLYHFSF